MLDVVQYITADRFKLATDMLDISAQSLCYKLCPVFVEQKNMNSILSATFPNFI